MELLKVFVIICSCSYPTLSYPFSDGDIRLIGGVHSYEGTVLIFHDNAWGSICDYHWDIRDAHVVCRQLGYPRALQHVHGSNFGRGRRRQWLADVYCRGDEARLSDCYFPGWGRFYSRHERACRGHRHSAGVVCLHIETTTAPPTLPPFAGVGVIDNNINDHVNSQHLNQVLLGDEADTLPILRNRNITRVHDSIRQVQRRPTTTTSTTTRSTTTTTIPTTTPTSITTTTTTTTTTPTPSTTTTSTTTSTTTPAPTTTVPTTSTTRTTTTTTKATTTKTTTTTDIAAQLPYLPVSSWRMDKQIEMWVMRLRNGEYLVAKSGDRTKRVSKEQYISIRRELIKPPTTTTPSFVFVSNRAADQSSHETRKAADDPAAILLESNNGNRETSQDLKLDDDEKDEEKKEEVDKDVDDMLKEDETEKEQSNTSYQNTEKIQIKISGGRSASDGRIEVLPPNEHEWGVICGDNWTLKEAIVACRHFGLGYGMQAAKTAFYGGKNQKKYFSAVRCKGTEKSLDKCIWEDHNGLIQCSKSDAVAAIVCATKLPDLEPSTYMVESTAFLQDRHMYFLTCAMEENCLAPSAYELKRTSRSWRTSTRRLMRFSSVVKNIGTADFLPESRREDWEWHACHMHYHSMEIFAHYDITDLNGNRVAEGLKASFCLEDSQCDRGVYPKYDCQNWGQQGISVGCSDNYMADIDCQWIDITDLKPGNYHFKLEVNPNLLVPEISFDNNGMNCDLYYSGYYARITNCKLRSIL